MSTTLETSIEQAAYDIIEETQPLLLFTLTGLLLRGQSPQQITSFVAQRDVMLAGIVEMALPILQAKITKSSQRSADPCKEEKQP